MVHDQVSRDDRVAVQKNVKFLKQSTVYDKLQCPCKRGFMYPVQYKMFKFIEVCGLIIHFKTKCASTIFSCDK